MRHCSLALLHLSLKSSVEASGSLPEQIFRRLLFFNDLGANVWCSGTTPILKKRSENAGANENLSCGFPSIPGIAPGVAPRIMVFILLKSWDAIPRMEFRIPRMEFQIPRAAPRIPRNSPRELRNIYHHHPESKKRISSEEKSGFIQPYGRYGNAVKLGKPHLP